MKSIQRIVQEEVKKHKKEKIDEGFLVNVINYVEKITDKARLDYVRTQVEEEIPEYKSALQNLEQIKQTVDNQIKQMSNTEKQELADFMRELGL